MNRLGIGVRKHIADFLRKAASDIEADKCGLDDDEILDVASALIHRKLTMEQVSHMKHYSTTTLKRRINSEAMPPPHKEPGGKKYMYQDEIFLHEENLSSK